MKMNKVRYSETSVTFYSSRQRVTSESTWTLCCSKLCDTGPPSTTLPNLRIQLELVRILTAHGDAREGKWRGNWRMEWVASTLTPPPNMVYPGLLKLMRTTSVASSRLNWRPHRFKWTRPFRGKTKSGFCAFRMSYTSFIVRSPQSFYKLEMKAMYFPGYLVNIYKPTICQNTKKQTLHINLCQNLIFWANRTRKAKL